MAPPKLKAPSTPELISRSRASSTDSIDEAFFLRPYVPLSNLPTPPLCSRSSTRNVSPEPICPGNVLDPEFFGPAVHLKNLIPVSTSFTRGSIPLIQAMLTRAALPMEIIALSVCILQALNSRFPQAFRKNCPLTPPPKPLWSHVLEHNDNLLPDLLVLAALILAVKFLEDFTESTSTYRDEWGSGIWSVEQINYAQDAILENIGYRIFPLWAEDMIEDALRCMKLAGELYEPIIHDDENTQDEHGESMKNVSMSLHLDLDTSPMSSGKAVKGLADQLTPAETPNGTEDAFYAEPFPAYVDPGFGVEKLGLS